MEPVLRGKGWPWLGAMGFLGPQVSPHPSRAGILCVPPAPCPGPWTLVNWGGVLPCPLCTRLSPLRPPPAPAVPPAARGDGAHRDHPHPGARGAHQGAGEPQPSPLAFRPGPQLSLLCQPSSCFLSSYQISAAYCGNIYINLPFKCAVLRYEIHSHCCASITIIHFQNFSSSPHEIPSPQILAPTPLPLSPWDPLLYFLFL